MLAADRWITMSSGKIRVAFDLFIVLPRRRVYFRAGKGFVIGPEKPSRDGCDLHQRLQTSSKGACNLDRDADFEWRVQNTQLGCMQKIKGKSCQQAQ